MKCGDVYSLFRKHNSQGEIIYKNRGKIGVIHKLINIVDIFVNSVHNADLI
jgi:hypothetical protein